MEAIDLVFVVLCGGLVVVFVVVVVVVVVVFVVVVVVVVGGSVWCLDWWMFGADASKWMSLIRSCCC